jgi:hypothetical protein
MPAPLVSFDLPDPKTYEALQIRASMDTTGSSGSSVLSSPVNEKEVFSRLRELSEKDSLDSWRSSTDTAAEIDELLESQLKAEDVLETPLEYLVPLYKKLTFLGFYFVLNVALTLSNKQLLLTMRTPWLLTVLHAFTTSVGCLAYIATGRLKLSPLSRKEHLILVAFSSLFTLNIAVSNISL